MSLRYLCSMLALIIWVSTSDAVLRFANYYHNHMVLQMQPAKAQVWGYASTNGDTVAVSLNGHIVANVTVHNGQWSVLLPAQNAGTSASISVSSKDGHASINDVLFGDVWVCSGQSNMYFKMKQVFNHTAELIESSHFNKIRIMKISIKISNTTLEEPSIITQWQKPANDTRTGDFSAVCLLYAMELAPHINRPIGLVETSVGGTAIEAWSSQDALAACPVKATSHLNSLNRAPESSLWNGMVEPLLEMTIYGAIWYQGEANSPHPDDYVCQFPAMINDWRTKFNVASQGQTNIQFPFGFVQLAANVNRTLHAGFPDLRWSQTAKYGYVPNPLLPNVFMAVAMDLPDFDSPYGTIHPRDKQDVAVRLALAGRAVAYGENNLDYQGPFPSNFQTNNHTMTIEFDHGNSAIDLRSNDDFEVCCTHTANYSSCNTWEWKPAPVIAHDQSTVTIDTHICRGYRSILNSVRYAWEVTPCFVKQCGIYDQNTDLPAPPFIKHGPF